MLTKELDSFILDKDEPFWYVLLNNGDYVYQDDGRYDGTAWKRLCDYCNENNLYITNFWIRFRSNTVELPSNKDGYWFKKGLLAGFRKDNGKRFKDVNFFIVGYVNPNEHIMKVTKWRVPDIIDWSYEDREIPNTEVIWNHERKNRI